MLKELTPLSRRLAPRSKAVFHRQEPPIHEGQERGSGSMSRRMHLLSRGMLLFLFVFTCTGSL